MDLPSLVRVSGVTIYTDKQNEGIKGIMETEKVTIKHSFSDTERLALGEEQSELLGKSDELEATLKSAKAQIQAEIEACEANIRTVSTKLRSRYMMRSVDCMILDHRVHGMRHIIRMDNGHVVKARKLAPHETQIKLTTEEPAPFVAIALLVVDDRAVDADWIELHVLQAEWDILRVLPDVKTRDIPKGLFSEDTHVPPFPEV